MKNKLFEKIAELRELSKEFAGDASTAARLHRDLQVLEEGVRSIAKEFAFQELDVFPHPIGSRVELAQPTALEAGREAIVDTSNLLPVYFLEEGLRRQRSVARVVLTQPHAGLAAGDGWATGFMVSPNLLLTNNHVINSADFRRKVKFQFNFQLAPNLSSRPVDEYFPDLDGAFLTVPELDFTLVQLLPRHDGADGAVSRAGNTWGWISIAEPPEFFDGQYLNAIQHPSGREKKIAIQDNLISELYENVVRYTTDTLPGSSGSPVFDNAWRVVALHHASGRLVGTRPVNNQGIRIDAIVRRLRNHFSSPEGAATLRELGL